MLDQQKIITVVIPIFNEEQDVTECINRVSQVLKSVPHQILAINDGSTDSTYAKLKLINNDSLKILTYEENRGKGYALRFGIAEIQTPYGAFLDGDLDLHPDTLPIGLDLLMNNPQITMALGSKLHKSSRVNYSRKRKALSMIYRLFIRTLFNLNVSDTQTGLKVFRTEPIAVAALGAKSDGWSFDVELLCLVKAKGGKFAEVPVDLDYQFNTKLKASSAFKAIMELVWFRLRFKP